MNQKGIIKLLLKCSSDIQKLHDKIITELSRAVSVSAESADPDELYNISRDCTQSEKTKVQTLLSQYSNALQGLIQQGITRAILLSAETQEKALKGYTSMDNEQVDAWRKDTAKAFLTSRMKRDKGLNLSDRVWNYTQQTKSEFELAMSQAIEDGISKGTSAETLGRKVRQYLNQPDMMYRRYHTKKLMSDGTKKDVVEWRRRVVDENGKVHFVKEDLAKVGTGVYRSARQNALRLTITETNMAYNYSNCSRWADEPFVLGVRIRLSEAHPEDDICDTLEGDYPKTFMWRGWHPRCMCSISPILMDRSSEEWKKLRAMSDEDYKKYQSPNLVKEMPKKFKTWCDYNKDKLNAARERGKLPYFVRDNEKVVWDIVEQKIKFKEDSFYSDNKFGERLRINKNADKTEIIENIRCAHSILSSFNDVNITIREHLLEVGKKNPEYEINGYIADRKGIESPNGISAGFNKAIKQGCSIVVIDLDMHKDKFKQLPSIKLSSAINNRYSDFEKDIIKECYVVYNDRCIRITQDFFTEDKRKTKERIKDELDKIRGERNHLL